MRKLLALCFAGLLVGSAQAQVGLTGQGNVSADGAATTYTPTLGHGGVAPTSESATGWYKQIGSKLYEVGISYTIATLGSPTSFVSATMPLSLIAAQSSACPMTNSSTVAAGGVAYVASAGNAILFTPTTYAANTFQITCLVTVQ